MICYINRSTVDYDIRLQKYVQACLDTDTPYCVISWDRMHNCDKIYPNEMQFKMWAPYGAKMKNFLALVGWVFFVWYMLVKNWKKYKVIHACNIENAIIAKPFRVFGKKLVLDVYDSLNIKSEAKLSKRIEGLILPNDFRLNQIGIKKEDTRHYLEVENVPVFHSSVKRYRETDFSKEIRLAYVGVLRRNVRGLENLLSMVENDNRFVLDIAGVGDNFENEIEELARKCPRVHYFNKVGYDQALSIMINADFIVALYYLKAIVHKYASPNKFYESLYLGRPIITSKDTLVGNNVVKYNTGYVVDDTIEGLKSVFTDINKQEFIDKYYKKKENCLSKWKNDYLDYFERVTKGSYIEMMKGIAMWDNNI